MAYLPQLQEDAQANLPVIPNNGNPGGANNMPQTAQVASAEQRAPTDPLAWMAPSPYIANINQLLQQQAQDIADQKNRPYTKGQFMPVATQQGWMFRPIDDNDLPIVQDNNTIMQIPLHQETDTPAPAGIVLPMEYKDKLRNGQIY